MCSSHFARACHEVRVVRVISTARVEKHVARAFSKIRERNGNWTGFDILFSQIGNIIVIELSIDIFCIGKQSPIGDRRSILFYLL